MKMSQRNEGLNEDWASKQLKKFKKSKKVALV